MSNPVILTETITVTHHEVTDRDKELAADYSDLIDLAMKRAKWMLRYGAPDTQLSLIKTLLSGASRLAAIDSKTETEEHRRAFEGMISAMKTQPALSSGSYDQPPALHRAVVDQDYDDGD